MTVREESSDADLAVLELSWGGSGLLKTPDGARFRWERPGFWARRFVFTGENGLALIGFEPTFGLVRRTGTVQVGVQALKVPEFGLLGSLGWYVIMLTDDEAAGAAVICCS